MKFSFLAIEATDKGLRPVVVGQPNRHIMDWRGCSFVKCALPGWKRGKRLENTYENIVLLRALNNAINHKALRKAISKTNGAWSGDYDKTLLYGDILIDAKAGRV